MTSRERFEAKVRALLYYDAETSAAWRGWQAALDSLDVEAAARRLAAQYAFDDPEHHSAWSELAAVAREDLRIVVRAILAAAKGE